MHKPGYLQAGLPDDVASAETWLWRMLTDTVKQQKMISAGARLVQNLTNLSKSLWASLTVSELKCRKNLCKDIVTQTGSSAYSEKHLQICENALFKPLQE